ncbi:MAG: DUF308 domain-containing protein, partial [Clostridia bacterium]|nr:DUF308 domain-containing protein [Clostridia bacterium]
MIDKIKKFSKMSIATSILLIIFSLFLIFKPEASLNFMVRIIGVALALTGIVHMVSYFTANKEFKTISTELIQGTIFTIIGLVFIFNPSILNEFLGIIIGAWLILQFIVKFQFAFNLKSASSPAWSIVLISSILHLVFGLIMFFNPFSSIAALTTIA